MSYRPGYLEERSEAIANLRMKREMMMMQKMERKMRKGKLKIRGIM